MVVWEICFLKALNGNVRFLVELFRKPACERVNFHTVELAVLHTFGKQTKEIACAAGRLYVPTDFDTKEKALSGAKAAEKGLK